MSMQFPNRKLLEISIVQGRIDKAKDKKGCQEIKMIKISTQAFHSVVKAITRSLKLRLKEIC